MNYPLLYCFKVFVAIGLVLQSFSIYATNYYISAAGNNANNGTSSALPWQTIVKINASMSLFQPGDSILFRRGDTFRGQILLTKSGSSTNKIVFGAYGSGSLPIPILSGGQQVSGWSVLSGNKYKVAMGSTPVYFLFANENIQTLARFPNTGMGVIQSGSQGTATGESSFNRSTNYWQGGTVRIRTSDFTYDFRGITSSNGATVNWPASPGMSYAPSANWGMYIDGIVGELDVAGEWVKNTSTNDLEFWAPNSVNPNTLSTIASVEEYGIRTTDNVSNITVRNLQFQYQGLDALLFNGTTTGILVENCVFRNIGSCGVELVTSTNSAVNSNTFRNVLGAAISTFNSNTGTYALNDIRKIGLVRGYGYSGLNNMEGIVCWGGFNNYIGYNKIDSVGQHGIRSDGEQNYVQHNTINNAVMLTCDAGGLYSWGSASKNSFYQYNFVSNCNGDFIGTNPAVSIPVAIGIYIDNDQFNHTIQYNVAYNNGEGMLINTNNSSHKIQFNTLYNNKFFQLLVGLSSTDAPNHLIENNTMYSLSESAPPLIAQRDAANVQVGTFSNNYFINPFNKLVVRNTYNPSGGYVTTNSSLKRFESSFGGGSGGKISKWYSLPEDVVSTGAELIPTGNFNTTTEANNWQTFGSATRSFSNAAGLSGSNLEVSVSGGGSGVYPPTFNLAASQKYLLTFNSKTNTINTGVLRIQEQGGGFGILSQIGFFPQETSTDYYQKIFTTPVSGSNNERLNFQPDVAGIVFNIDNVSLKPVTTTPYDPTTRHQLFTNTGYTPLTIPLSGSFFDIDSLPVSGSITLASFSSKILIKVSDCVDYTVSTVPNYPNGTAITLKAPNTITAANSIGTNANVTYQAGKSVTLLPGFKVEKTTVFRAQLGGCN